MAMSKKDLVAAVSEQSGYSKKDVEAFLDAQEAVIQGWLGDHAELTLPGIGKLSVGERAARIGRNPRTGESVNIPAKKTVKFTAAKALKDSVA